MFNITTVLYLLMLNTVIFGHANNQKIVQISIPKSGTHLLAKCIALLTSKNNIIIGDLFYLNSSDLEKLNNLPDNLFLTTHVIYTPEHFDLLNNDNFIKLFMYRDPRDVVVSTAFYMLSIPSYWPEASLMSFDALLLDIINIGSALNYTKITNGSIMESFNKYSPWLNAKDILTIKFEDLVGPQGGGDLISQTSLIKKIAEHLKIDLTADLLKKTIENLFGTSGTFREGKIGSWKKYFKEEHVLAFKEVTGSLLIDLGYEPDMNW